MMHFYFIEYEANFGQFRPTKADWLHKKLICSFDHQIMTKTDFIVYIQGAFGHKILP